MKTTSSLPRPTTAETEEVVLKREDAIPKLITPTGRKVGAIHIPGTAMYRLGFVDGKPGDLPFRYSGTYTGLQRALMDAKAYVTAFWDTSDSKKSKENGSAVRR